MGHTRLARAWCMGHGHGAWGTGMVHGARARCMGHGHGSHESHAHARPCAPHTCESSTLDAFAARAAPTSLAWMVRSRSMRLVVAARDSSALVSSDLMALT